MENNIFKYAPNELTQDAFICWLLNEKEDENIKTVAHSILRDILKDAKEKNIVKEDVESIKFEEIEIYPQISVKTDNYKIYDEKIQDVFQKQDKTKKINRKIDILVIINKKYAIIIEDKVDTLEHGFQLLQYKKALKNKKEFKNYTILTCYYKTFDECNLNNKENYIDSIMNREKILNKLNTIKTNNLYFNDYKKYLTKINEISNTYQVLSENVKNYLKDDKILDIRYLGLLKAIDAHYWGKAIEGIKYTWWCTNDIDMEIESENDIFWNNFFIKINFYENEMMRISLRIGKRWKDVIEGERREKNTDIGYVFDENKNSISAKYCDISKRFNQREVYEELKNKNLFYKIYKQLKQEGILKYCIGFDEVKQEENKLIGCETLFKPRGKGKDQKYELTIFTIQTKLDIYSKGMLEKATKFIKILEEELNEQIKLETIIRYEK